MRTNSNRSSSPWVIATARRRLVCSSLVLCASLSLYALYGLMMTPAALADESQTLEDLQLQVKNLLNPAVKGSWGDVLNSGFSDPAHWDAMQALYHEADDPNGRVGAKGASLLPTVKNEVYWRNAEPMIKSYFQDHFLPAGGKKPYLVNVFDQHVVIMGDYASNQGLYIFDMLDPATLKVLDTVSARFTFVYKKLNPNQGWTLENTRIIQHHSSKFPCKVVWAAGSSCPQCPCCVDVDDLFDMLLQWGQCGYYGTPAPPES